MSLVLHHSQIERWKKHLKALEDYQMSMVRIGEGSEARDREEMGILTQISMLRAAIKRAEEDPSLKLY